MESLNQKNEKQSQGNDNDHQSDSDQSDQELNTKGDKPKYDPSQQNMSKRQFKKMVKQQKWEQKRQEKKMKNKEKYKKSANSYAHIKRFNEQNQERQQEGKPKLSKQDKQQMFKELCLKGPKYVIDCEFEDYMQDREFKSLGQQLSYCYSTNKRLEQPMNIYFTGVGDKLAKILESFNCKQWPINIHYKQSYIDLFEKDKDKLVYLTADSENLIEDLDPDMIYIIGGIVDHNRYKLLTYNKANSQNIKHARLPIRENVKLETSAVLTVNHVIDIIAMYLKTRNWKESLETAIPSRKIKHEGEIKDEDDQKLKEEDGYDQSSNEQQAEEENKE